MGGRIHVGLRLDGHRLNTCNCQALVSRGIHRAGCNCWALAAAPVGLGAGSGPPCQGGYARHPWPVRAHASMRRRVLPVPDSAAVRAPRRLSSPDLRARSGSLCSFMPHTRSGSWLVNCTRSGFVSPVRPVRAQHLSLMLMPLTRSGSWLAHSARSGFTFRAFTLHSRSGSVLSHASHPLGLVACAPCPVGLIGILPGFSARQSEAWCTALYRGSLQSSGTCGRWRR